MNLAFDNQLDDLVVLEGCLEFSRRRKLNCLYAVALLIDFVERTIRIIRIECIIVANARGNAEMLSVADEHNGIVRIDSQEAQTAFTSQSIERIGLQISVSRRCTNSWHIVGKLTYITTLPNLIRLTTLLARCGEEVCCEHIIDAILDEENLDVLLRILRYLCQSLVDVRLIDRHRMSTIIIDGIVREWFEEAPESEEVGQILLDNLTHFADELQAACIRTVQSQRIFAKRIEKRRIERSISLCKMIV